MLDVNNIILYTKHPICKIYAVNVAFILYSSLYKKELYGKKDGKLQRRATNGSPTVEVFTLSLLRTDQLYIDMCIIP